MTYYFHVAPTCISHTQQICVCQIMCLFGSSRVHTPSFLKVGIKPRNWEGSPASYLLSGEMHLPFLASKWSTDAFTFISPKRRRFFALSIRGVRVYSFLQKAVEHSQLFAWLKKNLQFNTVGKYSFNIFGSQKKACYAPVEEWWVFSQVAACVRLNLPEMA